MTDQVDMRTDDMEKRSGMRTEQSGYFRAAMMAVLMVATAAIVFSLPQQAQAHFGQAKNDPCIDCHNGNGNNLYVSPWDFTVEAGFIQDPDAVMYLAVDGVDESPGNGGGLDGTAMQVTVAPSTTIELDVLWKNKGGGNASDLMIKFPDTTNWTGVGVGTAGSAPVGWNPDGGGVWNTAWDQGTLSGGTPGLNVWQNLVGDADKGSVPNAESTKFWVLYTATGSLTTGASNVIIDSPTGRVGSDIQFTVPATPATYTVRLYAVGHSASKDYKSTDLTVIVSSGGDVTPPALVTNFTATSGQDSQVPLSWTNPADVDLAEVLVMRKELSYPTDHLDVGATQVYQNLTPVASGAETPTDTTGPPVNGTTYYYAVFSRDSSNNWNDTVTGGSNANTATPTGTPNNNPNDPTNLAQLLIDGVTPIGIGGYTTEASVVFEADLSDPDGADTVKLQIDTNSDGTFDCESALVAQQIDYQLTCPLADGSVNWQARTVDNIGAVSNWVAYNAADPDVIKDASAPTGAVLTATPGDGQIDLTWTAAVDTHSGIPSPAYAIAKATGVTPPADCSSPLTTTDLTSYTDGAVTNGTTYSYRLCVSNNAGLETTTTDSTTPAAGCTPGTQTVTLLPGNQTIAIDGGYVIYRVQVFNNDPAVCGNTTFAISASNDNTTNFFAPQLLNGSLTIAPQTTEETQFRVTARPGETVGTVSVDITANEAGHGPQTSAPLSTDISITGGGCVAPGDYINTNGDRLTTSRR